MARTCRCRHDCEGGSSALRRWPPSPHNVATVVRPTSIPSSSRSPPALIRTSRGTLIWAFFMPVLLQSHSTALHVFFVIRLANREILHVDVTRIRRLAGSHSKSLNAAPGIERHQRSRAQFARPCESDQPPANAPFMIQPNTFQ